jgi:hypothetical protein
LNAGCHSDTASNEDYTDQKSENVVDRRPRWSKTSAVDGENQMLNTERDDGDGE